MDNNSHDAYSPGSPPSASGPSSPHTPSMASSKYAPPPSTAVPVNFIIKFSDSTVPDLSLQVEDVVNTTVSGLRRLIRDTVGGRLINRRLRLIHSGRVLSEKMDLAKDVVKLNPKGKGVSSTSGGLPKRVYIHCSVGDILSAQELAQEAELDQAQPVRSTAPELRGFDRLRNAGFSEGDVAALRRQFSSLHGVSNPDASSGAIPNVSSEEELTRLEEQWINTGIADAGINTAADVGSPLSDDYLEELIGLLAGMFLGILAVIFLKEGNAVFNQRQRRSVLAGVAINFSFAFVRMFN